MQSRARLARALRAAKLCEIIGKTLIILGSAGPHGVQKVAGSNPVTPTGSQLKAESRVKIPAVCGSAVFSRPGKAVTTVFRFKGARRSVVNRAHARNANIAIDHES